MRRAAGLLLAGALALSQGAGQAQTQAAPVSIGGQVQTPASYTITGLATLPAVEVQAAREGGAMARYVGPLLWPILETAKLVDGPARGAHLQHAVLARGADGYAVLLSIGEIDPGFEGKPVIIAYKQDGVLLEAPRLVVPGDRKAGRNVRGLVAIDVQ